VRNVCRYRVFLNHKGREKGNSRHMAFERHRDKNGEISRKHGNTLIGTLRKHYGSDFAFKCAESERLSDCLHKVDEPSLSKLVRDHQDGKLERICSEGA
jgi:hypothetical protein